MEKEMMKKKKTKKAKKPKKPSYKKKY